jgi:hypothetical protein
MEFFHRRQNQRVESSHKKSSNIWRRGVFAVSLMLLILGLCGIFSPAKQGITSAFRSMMSQPQTVTRYETKNIEDIRKDDQVLAYDVRTGEVTKRKVTQVFKRQADHIRYLTIRGENGIQQTVQTTDNHAFWVVTDKPDLERMAREMVTVENVGHEDIELFDENLAVTENGFYVEAKNLRVGDRFLDSSENLLTLIETRREEFPNGITVYNFTVEDDHNYFVIANYEAFQNGSQPVLVHNSKNCSHGNSKDSSKPATLYAKLDKNGNFLKWGISQNPAKRYTKKQLDGGELKTTFARNIGNRSDILKRERKLVERFPGSENHEPWAGRRKPERPN